MKLSPEYIFPVQAVLTGFSLIRCAIGSVIDEPGLPSPDSLGVNKGSTTIQTSDIPATLSTTPVTVLSTLPSHYLRVRATTRGLHSPILR